MLLVHSPEAEAVHYLSQCIVLVVKLDGAHHCEYNFTTGTHIQGMDRSWNLSHIVASLANPVVPAMELVGGLSKVTEDSTYSWYPQSPVMVNARTSPRCLCFPSSACGSVLSWITYVPLRFSKRRGLT